MAGKCVVRNFLDKRIFRGIIEVMVEKEQSRRRRLRFGLDLDGVIYDFHSAFRFLANYEFGLGLPETDKIWPRWDGHMDFMTKEQDSWMWSEGVRRGLFRHGNVRKGAIEFTQALDQIADIVIITHRPKVARQDTLDWLAFHRIPAKEIHLLENQEPKWRIDVDVLLDDKWQNVIDFARNTPITKTALLWDRAWNRAFSVLTLETRNRIRTFRIRDFKEALAWVEGANDFTKYSKS